ncbi:MAG TPA: hypothetical protein DCX14_03420 [Flavobacteriales bacterium]|jgi:hypothetical protein|nr:LptE family protein [Flavobacteriales bacterium]HAW19209.1 hypothetical protein [Flavobacteriales bacterium]
MNLIKRSIFILVLSATALAGCKVNYSFTGASVSPDVNTISIATFPNYASLAPPSLSQAFTEELKDIFLRQTNLALVKENGDLIIAGEITNYSVKGEAVKDDATSLNKLTIVVKVRYTDTKDDEKSFEQTFSGFQQFDANTNLSSVEQTLIDQINEQLTQDIFNKSLGNW